MRRHVLHHRYGRAAGDEPPYAPEQDRRGRDLHPGDRVRFKLYPRGTAEGVVVVSARVRLVLSDGRTAPALAIESDGVVYALSNGGVTKLGGKK